MQKRFLSVRPVFWAAAVVFFLPFFAIGDGPDRLYVDADASGTQDGSKDHPFETISQAIDRVDDNDGTKIYVAEGEYEDNFNIPEDAQVIGAGADETIIDSDNDRGAVVYMEHGTKLSGVTLRGAEIGVMVKEDSRADIYDSVIKDNDHEGVFLLGTGSHKDRWKATIANTVIEENGRSGVYANDRPVVIVDSVIKDNEGDGINLSDDVKLWLEDTTVEDNHKSGIFAILDGSDIHVIDCELKDNGREGMEVDAFGKEGYVKVDNTNIEDNDRWGFARVARTPGIDAVWSDVVLKKNDFDGNDFGSVSPVVKMW